MTPALGKGFKVDAFDAEGTCGVVWCGWVSWCFGVPMYMYIYVYHIPSGSNHQHPHTHTHTDNPTTPGVNFVLLLAAGSGIAPIRAAIESEQLGLKKVRSFVRGLCVCSCLYHCQ